jgi:hypothetical protein
MVRRAAPKTSTETSIPALEKELAQLEVKIEKARSKALADAKKQSEKLAAQLSKLRAKAKAERGKAEQAKAALRLKKTPAKQNRLIKITDGLKLVNEQISEIKDQLAAQQNEFKTLKADIKNTKLIAAAVAKAEKALGIKRNNNTESEAKAPAKKAPAKKKTVAKKAPSKKTPTKKAPAQKAVTAKKAVVAKKTPVKKAATKKSTTTKDAAKPESKSKSKAVVAKKPTKRTPVKKTTPKAKKVAKKMPAEKIDVTLDVIEEVNVSLTDSAVAATESKVQTDIQDQAQTGPTANDVAESATNTDTTPANENAETAPSLFK